MIKKIRIVLLLGILIFVSGQTISQQLKASSWERTLKVTIYPVNGDGSIVTTRYLQKLETKHFKDIEIFMHQEAYKYGIDGELIKITVAPPTHKLPPEPPIERGVLNSVLFSLHFRSWAFLNQDSAYPSDIRIFVVYHDPDKTMEVPHSLALRKGMVGLVHAFADESMAGTNNFVINHEMLHTLGATDKYDLETNMPHFPEGYARPFQLNQHQQAKAEIMGGRIPIGQWDAVVPESLQDVVIGSYTALELNWFN